MAKTATDLLNELSEKDPVPGAIVASLRAQVAKSATPVAAQTVAKLLIDRGHLTAAQAQKLLGQPISAAATSGSAKNAGHTATKSGAKSGIATASKPPAAKALAEPAKSAAATQTIAG